MLRLLGVDGGEPDTLSGPRCFGSVSMIRTVRERNERGRQPRRPYSVAARDNFSKRARSKIVILPLEELITSAAFSFLIASVTDVRRTANISASDSCVSETLSLARRRDASNRQVAQRLRTRSSLHPQVFRSAIRRDKINN
jgi:hypothetical protein